LLANALAERKGPDHSQLYKLNSGMARIHDQAKQRPQRRKGALNAWRCSLKRERLQTGLPARTAVGYLSRQMKR
jgi:hypothetical protein